jgi:hypothetical protein
MTRNLDSCKYMVLPGKPAPNFNGVAIYNSAYDYWKTFWKDVYSQVGEKGDLNTDDFLRQDFIGVLMHDEEIVGMHLYNLFDLSMRAHMDQRFMSKGFGELYFRQLKNKKVKTAMSLEYLTVDPLWRKSVIGISVAEILIGLALKIQKSLDIDAGIGKSRADVKVTQMVERFGAKVLGNKILIHNITTDLIVFFKNEITPHPDKTINQYVDKFWKYRTDLTARIPKTPHLKHA